MNDKHDLIPQAKVWGKTTAIFCGHQSEVHFLSIKAGGFSSRHRHRKINLFYIVSGTLLVEIGPDHSLDDFSPSHIGVKALTEGQIFEIKPNLWHRFRAATDCQVIEVYSMPEIDPQDIERADEGGLTPAACTCFGEVLNEWCEVHGKQIDDPRGLVHFV